MVGLPNPKNYTSAAAMDLNLSNGVADTGNLLDEEARKRRLLMLQRQRLGLGGSPSFALASAELLPGGGTGI